MSSAVLKVSANDKKGSYASIKIVSSDGSITFAIINPGANEQLDIKATGGSAGQYVQTAISYAVKAADALIGVTNTSADRDVTLLAPGAYPPGKILTIKDESGNAAFHRIRIVGTVDGVANPIIDADYGVMRIYTNGTSGYFTV